MTQLPSAFEQAHASNSLQSTLPTRRGDYVIQVAWPLNWGEDRIPPKDEEANKVSTIYVVDGNAYFFTATDVVRRLEFINKARAVVVAVGYPNKKCVFDGRRSEDLTAPCKDGKYDVPPGRYGRPIEEIPFGGASDFLDVIKTNVMTYVEDTLFPDAPLKTGRKALFGHSYGGLFSLNALFTKPDLFDTFIAASPSIWFNNCSITKEQEVDFRQRDPLPKPPRLLVTFGGEEQYLTQQPGETDERFNEKLKYAMARKMKDNAVEMVARLTESENVRSVWKWEFDGEDHGSAAVCAVQKGVMKFLLDIENA